MKESLKLELWGYYGKLMYYVDIEKDPIKLSIIELKIKAVELLLFDKDGSV